MRRARCRSRTPCGMAGWTASSRRNLTTFADDDARAHNTHSAVFAEVKVDEQLGVIRVTRVVSAVAAGRILNTKTAQQPDPGRRGLGHRHGAARGDPDRSQFGRIMNANIAEYHVPVNADIQDIEVIFVDEPDDSQSAGHQGASAKSALSASPRRSPTRSITRPASASATYRLRSTSYGVADGVRRPRQN